MLNNPLKYTDPFGWDTHGIGLNLQGGAGGGGSYSIMVAWDDSGNIALVQSKGGGGYGGFGGSACIQYQYTSADTVADLEGPYTAVGGAFFAKGGGGIEWLASHEYMGFNLGGGVGIEFDLHGFIEDSDILFYFKNESDSSYYPNPNYEDGDNPYDVADLYDYYEDSDYYDWYDYWYYYYY